MSNSTRSKETIEIIVSNVCCKAIILGVPLDCDMGGDDLWCECCQERGDDSWSGDKWVGVDAQGERYDTKNYRNYLERVYSL